MTSITMHGDAGLQDAIRRNVEHRASTLSASLGREAEEEPTLFNMTKGHCDEKLKSWLLLVLFAAVLICWVLRQKKPGLV